MCSRARIALLGMLAGLALVTTGVGLASATPSLSVGSSNSSVTTVGYSQASTDPQPAVLKLFAPYTFSFSFGYTDAQALGSVTGTAANGAITGTVQYSGPTDPVTYAGSTSTMAAFARPCIGSTTVSAYLLLTLTIGGSTVQIPMYAQQLEPDDPFIQSTGLYLYVCFPPAVAIDQLTLSLNQLFSVPGGEGLWHAEITPYGAGSSTLNPAGAVEAESWDKTPQKLALTAKRSAGTSVKVSGQLKAGAGPAGTGGQAVQILSGKKVVGTVKTKASGKFSGTVKTSASKLSARSTLKAVTESSGCVEALLAPLPCASLTIGGGPVVTTARAVTVSG